MRFWLDGWLMVGGHGTAWPGSKKENGNSALKLNLMWYNIFSNFIVLYNSFSHPLTNPSDFPGLPGVIGNVIFVSPRRWRQFLWQSSSMGWNERINDFIRRKMKITIISNASFLLVFSLSPLSDNHQHLSRSIPNPAIIPPSCQIISDDVKENCIYFYDNWNLYEFSFKKKNVSLVFPFIHPFVVHSAAHSFIRIFTHF